MGLDSAGRRLPHLGGDARVLRLHDLEHPQDEGPVVGVHLRDENGGSAIAFDQILLSQVDGSVRIRLDLDRNGAPDLADIDEDGVNDNILIDLKNTFVAELSAADFVF